MDLKEIDFRVYNYTYVNQGEGAFTRDLRSFNITLDETELLELIKRYYIENYNTSEYEAQEFEISSIKVE